jgi:Beta-lactamase enzyme family
MLAVLAAMLAFGSASPARAPAWHPDVRAAKRYALARHGVVSFSVRAQDGDGRVRVWGFRQDRVAHSASVIKAMLLMAYLKRPDVRDRALRPDEQALLSPMIRWSSNDAATRVLGLVGEQRLERAARRWGMTRFRVRRPWGASEITARDQARFWLRFDRLLPRRHRSYGLWLTRHVIPGQQWGMARVVPRGWRLHFKGGWGSGSGLVDHQVGLLRRGDQRVAIAILTTSQDDHLYGQETLRAVAARLVRGLAKLKRPAPAPAPAEPGDAGA